MSGPVMCRQCGAAVETARECYATPVCHACLPPPAPLPVREARRAPVQAVYQRGREVPDGTVSWAEHVEAWTVYAKRYGNDQSAERIAERHGFCFCELTKLLGHEPTTWRPR